MVNSSACYEESPGQIPDGEFYILLDAAERKFCNFLLVCTSENCGSADTQLWSNITLKRGIFKKTLVNWRYAGMQLRSDISFKSCRLLEKILIPDMRICSCGATFLEKVVATVAIVLPSNCGVSIASKKKIAHAHL
jgi:hypothetical protein